MFTDRQQNFYKRIVEISEMESRISVTEKNELLQAKTKIEIGDEFGETVNILNLKLQTLKNNNELSKPVEKLYEDLKTVYGPPKYRIPQTYYDCLPKSDWRNSDSDFVFMRAWNRWDEIKMKGGRMSKKENFYLFLNSFFIPLAFWVVLFTPLISWLKKGLNPLEFWILVCVAFFLFVAWLVVSGNLRRKKKWKVFV